MGTKPTWGETLNSSEEERCIHPNSIVSFFYYWFGIHCKLKLTRGLQNIRYGYKMSCNNIEILGAPRSTTTTTTTTTTTNETVSFGSGATFLYDSDRKWILNHDQTLTLTSVGTTSNLTTSSCIPEKGSSIQLQYARSPSSSSEEYSCGLTRNTEIQETIWKCKKTRTQRSVLKVVMK